MKLFLETMVLYPPVVSVAGFANVDRGMLRAVSKLTKELECCKKQVVWFCFVTALRLTYIPCICGRRLVSVPLDRLVYCTGTFTHISVGVLLLADGQKLGVPETVDVLLQRVSSYEKNTLIIPNRYSVIN